MINRMQSAFASTQMTLNIDSICQQYAKPCMSKPNDTNKFYIDLDVKDVVHFTSLRIDFQTEKKKK